MESRVLVYGAGVIGSVYALRFAKVMIAPWYRVKTKTGLTAWAYGGFIEKDGE